MDILRGIKETKVKPFRGGPKTVVLTDRQGVTMGIRVQPKYLTPLGAMVADVTAKVTTIVLVVTSRKVIWLFPEQLWL